MATTNIPTPEPSKAAKKVAAQDAELRTWLRVASTDRAFRPFWDEKFDPAKPEQERQPAPSDNGWGRPFDLAGMITEVFSEVDARTAQSTGNASPPSPERPKSGRSAS